MDALTRDRLRQWAEEYHNERFITGDPVQFPHRYRRKQDIEVSGLLTAILSFGVVVIAFGFKYRAAAFSDLPTPMAAGIARTVLPYGIALAPAQILFSLSSGVCLSFISNYCGDTAQGLFAFGYSLAQLVTAIQAGFSTYWGPYVYAHYREEQERIARVHDILNLLIFGFFCVLVMFEDIVFWIFANKRDCLAIFPLLMLAVVFTILCEGTVYGNSIARKPWHDTIGIAIGAAAWRSTWRCAPGWCRCTALPARRWRWPPPTRRCFCTAPSPARCTTAPFPALPKPFRASCWPLR